MGERRADLVELAEDWLAAKATTSTASNVDGATRARRNDLARWGRALTAARGGEAPMRPGGRFDLAEDLGVHGLDALSTEHLARALAMMRSHYDPATCRRSLATLRTFCRWLVRRGHLATNPADDDELAVAPTAGDDSAVGFFAFETREVDAMIAAAGEPPEGLRAAWAARDVAALRLLEGCGLRVAELCSLRTADLVLDADVPVVHVVRGAKRSKRRTVPLPRRTVAAVETYLVERDAAGLDSSDAAPLLVRVDGTALNQPFVDRLIRRVAGQGGVTMRGDAAAHGFRHYYGMSLALRGVPVAVIAEAMGHSDTRTTSIYMRAVGRHISGALDDAGWL